MLIMSPTVTSRGKYNKIMLLIPFSNYNIDVAELMSARKRVAALTALTNQNFRWSRVMSQLTHKGNFTTQSI